MTRGHDSSPPGFTVAKAKPDLCVAIRQHLDCAASAVEHHRFCGEDRKADYFRERMRLWMVALDAVEKAPPK